MSEFSNNWPASGSMKPHREFFTEGVDELESKLILPKDKRWHVGYAALCIGGSGASVLAYGEPGVGKTFYGNVVYGDGQAVDIQSDDTAGTLYGYQRPTDGGLNTGSVELSDEESAFFFDELSHLGDNTEALNKLWNSNFIRINGIDYDMRGRAIFATSNFVEKGERRVKPIGRALLDRFGMSIIGTTDEDTADKIQDSSMKLDKKDAVVNDGLLPSRETRMALKKLLVGNTVQSEDAGKYVREVAQDLNELELFKRISIGDGRVGEGWMLTAVANRFARRKVNSEKSVEGMELAETAAMSIGTITQLDVRNSISVENELTNGKLLDELDKMVFARRLTAAVAFKRAKIGMHEELKEEDIADFIKDHSYAESDPRMTAKMDEKIIDIVTGRQRINGHEQPKSSKRKSFRFSNR